MKVPTLVYSCVRRGTFTVCFINITLLLGNTWTVSMMVSLIRPKRVLRKIRQVGV